MIDYLSHHWPAWGEHVNSDGWPSGRPLSAGSVMGRSVPAGGVQWPGQPSNRAGEQRGGLPDLDPVCAGRKRCENAQRPPPLIPEQQMTWARTDCNIHSWRRHSVKLCELVLTWKKHALQHRGRPGGRGLLLPPASPLSSSRAWSRDSSRSTILTADTNGVGFCRARARALLTTAHSSLPAGTWWMLRML